jgi:hypothetical protein
MWRSRKTESLFSRLTAGQRMQMASERTRTIASDHNDLAQPLPLLQERRDTSRDILSREFDDRRRVIERDPLCPRFGASRGVIEIRRCAGGGSRGAMSKLKDSDDLTGQLRSEPRCQNSLDISHLSTNP